MFISNHNFLLHIWINFPKEYDVVLDGLESRLDETGDRAHKSVVYQTVEAYHSDHLQILPAGQFPPFSL